MRELSVRAPVGGRVSDRRVSLGDQVSAGSTLLTTVVSLDPIWFSFDGAESFYLKYQREAQRGQRASSRSAPNPVDIQLSDEADYNWHGRMEFVDNAIDPDRARHRRHRRVRRHLRNETLRIELAQLFMSDAASHHRNVIDVRINDHCLERVVSVARREFVFDVIVPARRECLLR